MPITSPVPNCPTGNARATPPNSYYNSDGEDARFHLGFFLGGLNAHPLKRIKNNEDEKIIKDQMEQFFGHSVVNNHHHHTHSHIH